MPETPSPPAASRQLVIVTGSGRSGTSTVAGTLKKLGVYVPQPEIAANEANPRGYFEPKWAVEFHKRVLADAGVRTLDARPEAWDLMAGTTSKKAFHAELADWFATQLRADQVVVKDPRAFWLAELWVDVASGLGVSPSFLTMLRHPTEVVASRDMHYLKNADDARRLSRETANIGGWVNVALTNERASRGHKRVFVHYTAMIEDWRSAITEAGRRLGLVFDSDLESREHHEVDDFIDVSLRRAQVTWDDLDVPSQLRDLAENVWQNLDRLSRDPEDAEAMAGNDEMRRAYEQMHTHAVALTQDHTNTAIEQARKQVRRRVTRELRQGVGPAAGPVRAISLPRRVARKIRAVRAGG
jgi:hypothetical protein